MRFPTDTPKNGAVERSEPGEVGGAPRNYKTLAVGLSCLMTVGLVACGGGSADSTPAQAQTASSVDTRRQALAAPTRLAVPIAATADPLLQGLTIPATAAQMGMWSPLQNWPMNAIHLALLPDGKVTSYGSLPGSPDVSWGRSFDFWTPSLGLGANAHRTVRIDSVANSFCNSQTLLLDGNMLLTGGVDSTLSALMRWRTGDVVPDTGTVHSNDRWYPTTLTLQDGRVLVVGGMDMNSEGILLDTPEVAIANGTVSMTPEIYTPGTGWRTLLGATSRPAFGPDRLRASFPKSWVAPNGKVFGISADTMWSLDVFANAGQGATTVLGAFKTPYSANSPVNVGTTASAVMFAPGRILQVGGNGGTAGEKLPGSNMATIVDINGPAPVLTEAAPMSQRRRMANATVLPDGRVVVTSGSRFANNVGVDTVFQAELWNPLSGTWTTGASAVAERVYHNTALLLPNGTLLSAGGGAPGPVSNQNAEIYYPPYLFRATAAGSELAPRPVVTGVNAPAFGHGGALQMELASGQTAKRLTLVRAGTVTHAFNNSQRFLELPFTQSGDVLSATLPANPSIAPPGLYQLFVVDAAGVPSNAVLVGLGMAGSTPAATPALTRGQTYALRSVGSPGLVVGSDAAGLGVVLGAADAATAPPAAQFVVRDGLADAACVSLEAKARAGSWLRQSSRRLSLAANGATGEFAQAATFCPELAPGGRGLVLRSKSHPGYVLRHRDGELWVDLEVPDGNFVASAAFEPVVVTGGAVNQPPRLSVTAPLSGSVINAGTAVTVASRPSDADGSVRRVEFYDGTTFIGAATASPWSVSWQPTVLGAHDFTAKGFDNLGASTVSRVVTVSVVASGLPVVTWGAPASGTTVASGATVALSATATASTGSVARVEFFDGSTLVGTSTSAPFQVTWSSTVAGVHSLSAKVFDSNGASASSAAVSVTVVGGNQPPRLSVTAPVAGSVFALGVPVTVSSRPADLDGFVRRVEFYDGTTLIGTATASPWSVTWNSSVAGPHDLTAKAFDNLGATTVSRVVTVTRTP